MSIEYYEFVSLYHPDRLCDYLVSCLLDYCISKDKYVDFRVDCTLADNVLNFIGNIKINYHLFEEELREVIRQELRDLNLLHKPINLNINILEVKTSKRDFKGPGIYYGFACNDTPFFIPLNYLTSYLMHQSLEISYESDYYKSSFIIEDKKISESIITLDPEVKKRDCYYNYKINYIRKDISKSIGMSGRKLGLDYYNTIIQNNGGSPWGKDPFNADLTINLFARRLAIELLKNLRLEYIMCKIICFSQNQAVFDAYDKNNNLLIGNSTLDLKAELAKELDYLSKPVYRNLCKKGLIFSKIYL